MGTKNRLHPKKTSQIQPETLVVGGLAVFLFGALLANRGVSGMELYVFQSFNNLSDVWRPLFLVVSFGGTLLFAISASIVAVIRKKRRLALEFLLASFGAWASTTLLKLQTIRLRPTQIVEVVHLRENLDSLVGYPSGHSAIAMAVGIIAFRFAPHYRLPITVLVLAVGVSRMYLGMHLPLDIIGGYAIGTAVAGLLTMTYEHIKTRWAKRTLKIR